MAIDKIFDGAVDGIADNLFNSVSNSVSEIKAMQQRKAAENVQLVVQALKKIDADIREKYDGVTETFDKRIASIKDGRDGKDGKNGLDGVNGKDGRDGKDGRNGRDGLTGPRGFDGPKGLDGKDGRDGEDGVSVTDAHIDFDGSLIISLSSGRVINVGEVVAADIAEKIKVITNGGGTSQPVLDKLASLQEQIDLIASALVYKGTWNASTNTPALASSVGTANSFYIVSVAGTTNLNGTSNWGVGDWAVFNGSVWQRVEGGAVGNFTDLTVSGTTTLSNLTASTALALNASKEVVSVTNTGTGNNVLATSPTLVTPALGTPSSATLTNATGLPLSSGVTGTLPIANGGTGQTTANAAFNALAPSQASNSGKYLTTNGTDTSWATLSGLGTVTSVSGTGTVNGLTLTGTVTTSGSLTLGGTLSGISNASLTNSSITINGTATSLGGSINVGTVTSVGATVPSFLSITGSPITSSGTLAIGLSGTALPTTSGGTGLTSFTANGVVYASSTSALATGSALTFDGSKLVNTGYNKSTYQVSTDAVGTFESVGAAYLTYDGATGASVYSRSNASAENTLTFRATAFSFRVAGTQVASLNSSTFSLYNIPILLSGSTSGYTGFAAPATSNFTIYTLPSTDGTNGQSLTTNGSGTLSWASGTGGTVTSVSGTGTVNGLTLTGTVTSSGSLTLGGTLSGIANSALTNSSITIGGTTIALGASSNTLANDITINGLTVGRGAGAFDSNTVVSILGLSANTTGVNNTALGRVALWQNTTGSQNSASGVGALGANTTGSNNTAQGVDALRFNTTASNNTAVGYQAAYSNVTGTEVTAVGTIALRSNTGTGSTAVGYAALYANTTGAYNVAVGNTLGGNTTGSYNTGVGNNALANNTTASNNTAVGYQALYSNTTGNINIALGYQAGYSTTNANYNTFLGYQAGKNFNTSGDTGNTFVGMNAGLSVTTGTGNTFVGAWGPGNTSGAGQNVTTGSKNTILGSYNGNQGGLDIRTASNYIVLSDGDGNPRGYWDGSQFWTFGANRRLRLADAYIGDNATGGNNSGWAFGAGGIFPADGAGVVTDNVLSLGSGSYRMATIYAGNGTINTSDANSKQDIENLSDAERRVAVCIKGLIKKFRFKDAVAQKGDDARIHVGVIAQEVQAAFAAEGLDSSRYALFCSDTWYEVDGQGFDENKRAFTSDALGAVEKTRLGLRYDELLAFVIAAL